MYYIKVSLNFIKHPIENVGIIYNPSCSIEIEIDYIKWQTYEATKTLKSDFRKNDVLHENFINYLIKNFDHHFAFSSDFNMENYKNVNVVFNDPDNLIKTIFEGKNRLLQLVY